MLFCTFFTLSILLLLIAAACLFILNRLRSRQRKPKRSSRFGFYPLAMGIAFQAIQAIVHPRAQIVVETIYNEQSQDDSSGDPNDPMQHLHRQAARIRRGEPIDCLTALLPSQPSIPAPPS